MVIDDQKGAPNSEGVWTNSLHIEQGTFRRKQRGLLRELRKFYCEIADFT